MKDSRISERLLSASKYVRQGARFADIGTDHAYLPIFLLSERRISHAVCADINKGPLDCARKHAEESGINGNIEFVLTDGASGLENKGITDYAVCGMGGELIADIIDRAPHLKDKKIRLILGAMSRQAHLRTYLYKNGFDIVNEDYALDSGKYYLILVAEYTGVPREISLAEAEIGMAKAPLSDAARGYFEGKARSYLNAAKGKEKGGDNSLDLMFIYEEMRKLL